jgi:ribokinase
MPNSPVDLVVVGPVTRDTSLRVETIPEDGGSTLATEIRVAAGGKGANPAVSAALLGARVRLIGAVGDDDVGTSVLAQLQHDGIDVRGIRRYSGTTTGQIVHLVEPDGHRRYIESPGANARLELTQADVAAGCGANTVVLLSTAVPRSAARNAAVGARAGGARVIVDLAGTVDTSRAVLDSADVVRGDAGEVDELTGCRVHDFASAAAAARRLCADGPEIAVVQAGEAGDLLLGDQRELRLARLPVTTADPTGAGDAMVATLAVLLGRGADLGAAARLASAAAAHTASHLGGRPTFADENELLELLQPTSVDD